MNKIYAGIGARSTPQLILDKFYKLGNYLAKKDYLLRSGGADGADSLFESGAHSENGKMEIYLPWQNFNNNPSPLFNIPIGAYVIASKFYDKWDTAKNSVKRLMSRNVLQILGNDLNTPVDFVICWTEEGKMLGGTSFAIKLAEALKTPVFNFGSNGEEEFKEYWKKNS